MGRKIHSSYDERVFIKISLRNGVFQKEVAIQLKRRIK